MRPTIKRSEQALHRTTGKKNIVAEQLRKARRRQKPLLTVEQLSDAVQALGGIELTASTIYKIEAGIRGVYDYEVRALAEALGVTTDWLLSARPASAQPPPEAPQDH